VTSSAFQFVQCFLSVGAALSGHVRPEQEQRNHYHRAGSGLVSFSPDGLLRPK
jgi:hypothetical protein